MTDGVFCDVRGCEGPAVVRTWLPSRTITGQPGGGCHLVAVQIESLLADGSTTLVDWLAPDLGGIDAYTTEVAYPGSTLTYLVQTPCAVT